MYKFRIGARVAVDRPAGTTIQTIVSRSKLKTVGMFTLPDGGPFYTLDDGDIVRQAQVSVAERLPVLFRRPRSNAMFANDGVTAVFPTLGWSSAYDMTCYAHVGQHGACDIGWYHGTRPATPEESSELLAELRGIYERSHGEGDDVYDLAPVSRMTSQHAAARRESM